MLSVFKSRQKTTLGKIKQELTSSPEALNTMSDEVLDEFTYIISMLKDDQVLLKMRLIPVILFTRNGKTRKSARKSI